MHQGCWRVRATATRDGGRELYAEMREEHYASLEERKFKTLAQVHAHADRDICMPLFAILRHRVLRCFCLAARSGWIVSAN